MDEDMAVEEAVDGAAGGGIGGIGGRGGPSRSSFGRRSPNPSHISAVGGVGAISRRRDGSSPLPPPSPNPGGAPTSSSRSSASYNNHYLMDHGAASDGASSSNSSNNRTDGKQEERFPSTTTSVSDEDEEIWFEQKDLINRAFPVFDEIRRSGLLCDVTLEVDGRRLSAHRLLLAGTIPYFRAMFTSNMAESSQQIIPIQGVDVDTLEALINFAYTGKVRICGSNVQNLMIGASFLQMNAIVGACSKYLQSRLQGSNVLAIRQFASLLGCHTLVRAADRFVNKHFVVISKTAEFQALPLKDLTHLLNSDELHVQSEEQVFEAALNWVEHDEEVRKEDMATVLACIRLPILKPQFIMDRVATNPLIRGDLRCRDLVDEAKDYHLMPERRALLQTFRTKFRYCSDIPGIIYAIGGLTNSGDSLSTAEMYDPMLGKWACVQPMSTMRSRVGVAVHDGLLYAIGGFNGHERLRTVEVFNPERKEWKEIAPLKNKRSALGSAVCQDLLYVCGGYDGVCSLASVEVYDRTVDEWTLTQSMSKPRSASGIAVLDGRIYILGGHDGMSIFNSVECYDPVLGRWSPVKNMLSRRCRLGACTLNGKIYACGGYDGQQFLKSVEVYDPERDEWTMLPLMNYKRSRVALVANSGRLFAIGGYDGLSNLSSMEIYNPVDDKWTIGAPMIAHEGGVGIGVVPISPKTDIS